MIVLGFFFTKNAIIVKKHISAQTCTIYIICNRKDFINLAQSLFIASNPEVKLVKKAG